MKHSNASGLLHKALLLLLTLSLTACGISSRKLGMSREQWHALSATKRSEILAGYYRVGLHRHKVDEHHHRNHGSKVHVCISGGTAEMWPYKTPQSYHPLEFEVHKNECMHQAMQSMNEQYQTELGVCFLHNALLIDPSRWERKKADATVRLYKSGLWDQGLDYEHIDSQGYVRLKDVTISVQYKHAS